MRVECQVRASAPVHPKGCCYLKLKVLSLCEDSITPPPPFPTDSHKIWYCGEDSKHQYGVTFIVWKEAVGSIISCTPVSSRLISITVIQVYAPTSDHEDEEVEQFYKQLDSIIAKTPKKDILVVQGDWNAKIGSDAYQHWAGTVGRFGIGDTNNRGWRPLEFTKSHRHTHVTPTSCPGQHPGMPVIGRLTTRQTST